MKKKGLIISTVVMVVVLIASLTTATYAWFSSSATATVGQITMNVGASAQVQIGAGTGTSATGYRFGDVAYKSNAWSTTDGTQGLGGTINTALALNVTAGIGTSANGTSMDSSLVEKSDLTKYYRGIGNDFASLKLDGAAKINGNDSTDATKSTDVVDLPMGIRIIQDNIYGSYCKITITPTADQQFIGMAAALHFEIIVGSKSYVGSIFDLINKHYNDLNEETEGYSFYFMIDEIKADKSKYDFGTTSANLVKEFSIRFFVNGYDPDCCNDATGTGATINISFAGCSDPAEPTDAGTPITGLTTPATGG